MLEDPLLAASLPGESSFMVVDDEHEQEVVKKSNVLSSLTSESLSSSNRNNDCNTNDTNNTTNNSKSIPDKEKIIEANQHMDGGNQPLSPLASTQIKKEIFTSNTNTIQGLLPNKKKPRKEKELSLELPSDKSTSIEPLKQKKKTKMKKSKSTQILSVKVLEDDLDSNSLRHRRLLHSPTDPNLLSPKSKRKKRVYASPTLPSLTELLEDTSSKNITVMKKQNSSSYQRASAVYEQEKQKKKRDKQRKKDEEEAKKKLELYIAEDAKSPSRSIKSLKKKTSPSKQHKGIKLSSPLPTNSIISFPSPIITNERKITTSIMPSIVSPQKSSQKSPQKSKRTTSSSNNTVSKSPIGVTLSQKQTNKNIWECDTCSYENDMKLNECKMCTAIRKHKKKSRKKKGKQE